MTCFVFCIFFICVVQCYCVDDTIILRSVDEDASFNCSHSELLDRQSCSRIKWTKYSSNGLSSKVILVSPETPEFSNAKRIKLQLKDRQNVLLLTKVQKSDEGVYNCEIWSGWECILAKNFTLKIKDCSTQDKKAHVGSVVTLNCSMGNQARVYNTSWSMLKYGNPVPLPNTYQVNGSTILVRSALTSDSGWYRCNYSLRDTQQRCVDINLQVQEFSTKFAIKVTQVPMVNQTAQISHSGGGFAPVHTVAVLAGVVFISALVGAALYWKHINKEVPQETREYDFVYDTTYDVVHEPVFTNQPFSQQQGQDEQMCTF
ncbi:hypothetical protein NL108_001289 [Boleophthalmus pectinirostris]|uniref:junctional adhesion molecule-like isoform X2 n=1 Tax=Boleophthalmus pectinirostris TaxID=150288 RepID=UPI00242B9A95|nr:junctional adhesion molecule-like isoform X2 [Boleophthalmus pectinirostris]KAJ0066060.1 hypothetical protein NL108_001289 [Boleophthalmus pectinirostris]